MPNYSAPTWTNGSGTAINATNLQNESNALAQAVQADGSGPNITAALPMTDAGKISSSVDSTAKFAFDLWGNSGDVGIYTENRSAHAASGLAIIFSLNAKYDPGSAVYRFMNAAGTAYQLYLDNTGIHARKSTNTPGAGTAITWGAATAIFT